MINKKQNGFFFIFPSFLKFLFFLGYCAILNILPGTCSITTKINMGLESKSLHVSKRAQTMLPPFIEDVIDSYSNIPDTKNLALGSTYFPPPKEVTEILGDYICPSSSPSPSSSSDDDTNDQNVSSTSSATVTIPLPNNTKLTPKILFNKYGSIQGQDELLNLIKEKLMEENQLDLNNMEVMVTAGGNQAFVNVALSLVDPGDTVLVLKPYYFSHVVSLQMAGANIKFVSFSEDTFLPNLQEVAEMARQETIKMIVLTTPNNPSGVVYPESTLLELKNICKEKGIWMVIDETYEHFVYNKDAGNTSEKIEEEKNASRKDTYECKNDENNQGKESQQSSYHDLGDKDLEKGQNMAKYKHTSLCGNKVDFPGIIHLYSFSKSYGMAGWRIGYMVYPSQLQEYMRRFQDTIPTHASIISQYAATIAMNNNYGGRKWVKKQIESILPIREKMWNVIEKHTSSIRGHGAIYYLVKLPNPGGRFSEEENEERSVDILAKQFQLLVTPGSAFGAPGHIRISYGSLPPEEAEEAILRLDQGLDYLSKN